ncbi:DUF1146 family protein [Listeria aquatica]|uniref:DUF1146 domain-containing protein n=2 Tax=Listeria aquatica TaxID=1494960 RepID=W7BEE1_9LIST|nr:DUF1146 family protein [Listeria aquatica]EUJ18168.1 hypothetical protein MAQA_10491 [Listeria aquatica FSL S10-1188]MBC1521856.1 DUF1146 domain-containing protein [Listeria aquatica]
MYNIVMEQPLTVILSHLIFIIITFWALQSINYEKFLRKNHVIQARLLFAILAIVIGYFLSSFFIDFLAVFRQLLH